MEGTDFNPAKIRTFYRGEGLGREEFAGVRIHAFLGGGKAISCKIDQRTGRIELPFEASWANVQCGDDVKAKKQNIVQTFGITILTKANAPIVVAQRQGRSNSYQHANVLGGKDLVEHHLPPCGISYFDDPKTGWSVWTKPMNRDQSNRVDIWMVNPDGSLELEVLYLLTLDNGSTFKIVSQQRWVGDVYLRGGGNNYNLPASADKRAQEVFANANARKILDKYVFVPGEHAEDFSSRMQILLDPRFRDLITELSGLKTWDGGERFWVERKPDVMLHDHQGWVKFLTYGVGRTSFGIINLEKPIALFGRTYQQLQFDHNSVDVDETSLDDQGLVTLSAGTIVEWEGPIDMGVNGEGEPYPAKVRWVTPLYEPLPVDVREAATV